MSAPFLELREAIDRHIEAVVDSCPYPASLYDPIRYVMRVGGKRVRPLLVLLSARSLGDPGQAELDLAAAVELLHTFTLVHDDIMDRDEMRRGQPTIHSRWDEGTAILAGDALIGLAYRCLARQDSPRLGEMIRTFTDAVVEVCEGQALDKEFEGRQVTLQEYEDMIARKTGRLISMSARIGALAAGGDDLQADTLEQFGASLGKAFQIQDDLLDYFSSTGELGKAVGSDLAMHKATYATLKGRQLLTGEAGRRLEELLLSGTQAGMGEIRRLLQEGGVLEAGQRDVECLAAESRAALARVLAPERRAELERFADWILNRTF